MRRWDAQQLYTDRTEASDVAISFAAFNWRRDPGNPVLPPQEPFDISRCMTPFAMQQGSELWLYYSGSDADGKQRICLATAPIDNPTSLTRCGVILDLGDKGRFDHHWCVLPCVHRFGDRWHLYYSGHEGSALGLQSFPGIGLAVSDDGVHFEKYHDNPVITGDRIKEFPDNRGIAGGGTILEDVQPDGSVRYRLYYTLATGTPSDDIVIDQEKHCAVCHSDDGILWEDHRLIMSPRKNVTSEDIAVAVPCVWRDGDGFRMIYCGIGSRWGFYSMSQAISEDGYAWDRGETDATITLAPGDAEWEQQMVEYPSVIRVGNELRLFYCGNGYGSTGIGTATCLAEDFCVPDA